MAKLKYMYQLIKTDCVHVNHRYYLTYAVDLPAL